MNENLPVEYEVITSIAQKEEALTSGIMQIRDKIMMSACEEVLSWKPEKQDLFLQKIAVAIAKDENLKPCFESGEGKLSIVQAIHRSVATGLEIGGVHAWLVPQGRTIKRKTNKGIIDVKVIEARYSIRDRGYHALLCGGKKPIFSDLRWGMVYKKDDCKVDGGSGEVSHIIGIDKDRGDFLGCWVQCEKISGQKEAVFFHETKILQWKAKAKTLNIWNTWPEEMAMQACIRHFCDRYEQAREMLASAIYDDEQIETAAKPMEEKLGSILDEKLEQPEPEKNMKDVTEDTQEEEKDTTGVPDGEELDLF